MNLLADPVPLEAVVLRPRYAVGADLVSWVPPGAQRGILWVPAMGVPARKYTTFAKSLHALGIGVALHEARGCASSAVRAGRNVDWGYRQLLEDIRVSQTQLGEAYPGIRWHVGGHSLGAQLAGLALALHPEQWAGYVIVGSGQPWWRSFPGWQQPILLGVFGAFRALSAVCGYFPGDRVGFAGREARSVVREWARSGLRGSYQVDGIDRDLEAALGTVRAAVLALHLSQDNYVPPASLTHLLDKFRAAPIRRDQIGPNEFSGGRAGHFDWLRDPQPVTTRIAQWMQSLGASHR
ncbi:MAG: alpha/beta hydrolase [Tahibacter sp.]